MKIESATVGLPVRDLERAQEWYQRLFDRSGPDVVPTDGVVEYEVGPIWVQLCLVKGDSAEVASGPGVETRFGVGSASDEHARLTELGFEPGELVTIPDVVELFDLTDPDGNVLSFYTEV